MTSLEHSGSRPGISLLIGSAAIAAQLCWGTAFAEGSFFKDRPGTAADTPQAKAAPPATAPPPAQVKAPEPEHAGSAEPARATGGAAATPQAQEPPASQQSPPVAAPVPPAPSSPPRSQPPAPAQVPDHPSQAPASAGSAMISGPVNEVLSTDTFTVNGQQVQIAGIRGRPVMLAGLKNWIAGNGGQLTCRPVGPKFRCATPNNKDVGLIVLANGAAELDAGAPPEYRQAQLQAQANHKGIWAQR